MATSHVRRGVRGTLLVLLAVGASGCAAVDSLLHRGPGVWGTVVSVDDTGLADSPAGGGWLAAVPAHRLDDLLALAGEAYPADQLAYVGLGLDRGTVVQWGGVLAEVDGGGDFRLPVEGNVVVCRLPSEEATYAQGCDLVRLPERGRARASLGEGGFHFWME
jgi:hypothetical protein